MTTRGLMLLLLPSLAFATDWATTCAAETLPASGVVYACDCQSGAASGCVAGNDANSGADSTHAIQTWGKVTQKWRSLPAGGTIALCRGGSWTPTYDGSVGYGDYNSWTNTSCTSGAPCLVRDYADARWSSANPPKISALGDPPFRIYNDSNTQDAGNNFRFINLWLQGGATAATAAGTGFDILGWEYNAIEICNVKFDGLGMGVVVGSHGDSTSAPYEGTTGYGYMIRGNTFTNICYDGLLFSGYDSDIDGNTFDNVGHDACENYYMWDNPGGGVSHVVYISTTSWPNTGLRLINNVITHQQMCQGPGSCSGQNIPAGGCGSGDGFHLNGATTGTVVENNDFHLPLVAGSQCTAISGGNSNRDNIPGQRNLVVRRNRVEMMGNNQALSMSCTQDSLWEDNLVVMHGPMGGNDYGSAIAIPTYNNTHACRVGSDPTTRGTIRNNTIVLDSPGTTDTAVVTFGMDAGSSGWNVTGNVVKVTGGSVGSCFGTSSTSAVAFMDNNVCYGTSSWANNQTLAAWQGGALDVASLTSDPLFTSTSNFTAQAGSPLINAGSTATTCTVQGVSSQACSSAYAIESATWSRDGTAAGAVGARDIGAFEYGTTVLLNRCVR